MHTLTKSWIIFLRRSLAFRLKIWWVLFFHKCTVNVQLAIVRLDFFFFPDDFNRVILSMKRGQEYTDYINASFIDVCIKNIHVFKLQARYFAVAERSF